MDESIDREIVEEPIAKNKPEDKSEHEQREVTWNRKPDKVKLQRSIQTPPRKIITHRIQHRRWRSQ